MDSIDGGVGSALDGKPRRGDDARRAFVGVSRADARTRPSAARCDDEAVGRDLCVVDTYINKCTVVVGFNVVQVV